MWDPKSKRLPANGPPGVRLPQPDPTLNDSVDGLEFFAGLEADGFARRNVDFGAGARVAADAGFAGAHVEDAEAAQFDAVAADRAFFMLSKTVSTASSALVLVIPVWFTTSLMMSSLITGIPACRGLGLLK